MIRYWHRKSLRDGHVELVHEDEILERILTKDGKYNSLDHARVTVTPERPFRTDYNLWWPQRLVRTLKDAAGGVTP
jgi:hypothetical protein